MKAGLSIVSVLVLTLTSSFTFAKEPHGEIIDFDSQGQHYVCCEIPKVQNLTDASQKKLGKTSGKAWVYIEASACPGDKVDTKKGAEYFFQKAERCDKKNTPIFT